MDEEERRDRDDLGDDMENAEKNFAERRPYLEEEREVVVDGGQVGENGEERRKNRCLGISGGDGYRGKSWGDEMEEEEQRRSTDNIGEHAHDNREDVPRSYASVAREHVAPLPAFLRGPRTSRPNSVCLHTEKYPDIGVDEIMDAVLKNVPKEAVKCLQVMTGPRFRLGFRNTEAKVKFLGSPLMVRGEKVFVQEMDKPNLEVKILYCPMEISNQKVAESLGIYGTIIEVKREMHQKWPEIETGSRFVVFSHLRVGIPRKMRIAEFPVETR